MRIAILDDSAFDREELRRMLQQYFSMRSLHIEVCEFSRAADFLRAFSAGAFQIAFLDIYLEGENGMDAARIACEVDPDCRLIFFTTSYDYAVDSYLVRAAYYLTKPVEQSRLCDAMDICCKDIDTTAVELRVERLPTRLLLKDICFVDCASRTVRVHLSNRVLTVDESFAQLSEALLADGRFLACNRGVLVNMEQIDRATERDFLLKNGIQVPIRVHGRGGLKKAWLSFSLKDLERRART